MDKKVQEAFKKLSKNMPDYKDFTKNFSIEHLQADKISVYELLKVVKETLEEYAERFSTILQPEASIISMNETNSFSSDDKQEVLETLRRIMHLHRSILVSQLDGESNSSLLEDTFKEWLNIKPSIKKILVQMQRAWDKEQQKTNDQKYFG